MILPRVHWCRRRGLHPQKFWFGEYPGNKIRTKSLRTFWNYLKIWGKMAPNMFWFENKLPELTWKAFFWRSHGARIDMTSFFVVFGHVWDNPGKIPLHPPNICLLLHLYLCKIILPSFALRWRALTLFTITVL